MKTPNHPRLHHLTPAEISHRAAQVLKQLSIDRPPVDPYQIAAALGVKVRKVELGDDYSAALVRKGDSAVVGLNWSHPATRQHFSLAHELGHYFLHPDGTYVEHGAFVTFRDKRSSAGTDHREVEANLFAANLLMPANWVRKAFLSSSVDPSNEGALQAIANRFGVSTEAMTIRLANLRLLEVASPSRTRGKRPGGS